MNFATKVGAVQTEFVPEIRNVFGSELLLPSERQLFKTLHQARVLFRHEFQSGEDMVSCSDNFTEPVKKYETMT